MGKCFLFRCYSHVSQEFANVLWLHKERKPATEYLQALLSDRKHVGVIEHGHIGICDTDKIGNIFLSCRYSHEL